MHYGARSNEVRMKDCVLRVAVSYNDGTLLARKDTPVPEPVVKGPRFQQATLQVGTSLPPLCTTKMWRKFIFTAWRPHGCTGCNVRTILNFTATVNATLTTTVFVFFYAAAGGGRP